MNPSSPPRSKGVAKPSVPASGRLRAVERAAWAVIAASAGLAVASFPEGFALYRMPCSSGDCSTRPRPE